MDRPTLAKIHIWQRRVCVRVVVELICRRVQYPAVREFDPVVVAVAETALNQFRWHAMCLKKTRQWRADHKALHKAVTAYANDPVPKLPRASDQLLVVHACPFVPSFTKDA